MADSAVPGSREKSGVALRFPRALHIAFNKWFRVFAACRTLLHLATLTKGITTCEGSD
jgi:hypothetical protein